jgi:hypothetical protein
MPHNLVLSFYPFMPWADGWMSVARFKPLTFPQPDAADNANYAATDEHAVHTHATGITDASEHSSTSKQMWIAT